MGKRVFVIVLVLVLVITMGVSSSTAAEDLPEINITWLSVSGRPTAYTRESNTLKLEENTGAVKSLDLSSGEVSSGWRLDWWHTVPIPFDCSGRSPQYNSDGSPLGVVAGNTEGKYGFVNLAGQLIIPCEYDWIIPSDHGESFAVEWDGKWGFVDASNELIIPFDWDWAEGFLKSRAIVGREDEFGSIKYGYIDRSGEVVIPLEYDHCEEFHEGLALVARKDEYGYRKLGYIDLSGNVVIPLEYPYGGGFHEGLAVVGWDDMLEGNILWGCIDTSGHMVFPVQYEWLAYEDGLIAARENGKYGYFNTCGEAVLPLEYDDVDSLGDGMYMVQKGASYGIFESPYWRNLESPNLEQKVAQSTIFIRWGIVVLLAVGVGGAAIFSLKRHKESDAETSQE